MVTTMTANTRGRELFVDEEGEEGTSRSATFEDVSMTTN